MTTPARRHRRQPAGVTPRLPPPRRRLPPVLRRTGSEGRVGGDHLPALHGIEPAPSGGVHPGHAPRPARRQRVNPSSSRWPSPRRSCATPTRPVTAGTRSSPSCWRTVATALDEPSSARRGPPRGPAQGVRGRPGAAARRPGADDAADAVGRRAPGEPESDAERPAGLGRSLRAGEAARASDLGRRSGVAAARCPAASQLPCGRGDPTAAVPRCPRRADRGYSRRLGGSDRTERVPMGLRFTYRSRSRSRRRCRSRARTPARPRSARGGRPRGAATTTTTAPVPTVDHHDDQAHPRPRSRRRRPRRRR